MNLSEMAMSYERDITELRHAEWEPFQILLKSIKKYKV